MSNRIDLTQFEGKGIVPLMVLPDTYTIAQDNNRILENWNYPEDDENRYGWVVGHIDSHYEVDDPEYGIVQSERQEAMAKLFAMAPDLITELKRCYDLIDAQKENIEFLNGAIEKLHEETWTEAVVEFVEEHHPSEWCDYSHCWKCEEETASE